MLLPGRAVSPERAARVLGVFGGAVRGGGTMPVLPLRTLRSEVLAPDPIQPSLEGLCPRTLHRLHTSQHANACILQSSTSALLEGCRRPFGS